MNDLIQIIDEIAGKVKKELERQYHQDYYNTNFVAKRNISIKFWCYQLEFCYPEINKFILEESQLFSDLEEIFKQTFIRSTNMKTADIRIIVLMAFVIVVVAYFTDKRNKPKQLKKFTHKIDETTLPPSHKVSSSVSKVSPRPAPIQPILKTTLVLVVSATQTPLINSIKAKRNIDPNDCEKLYEATRYLCQENEINLKPKLENLEQFIVQSGEESEYDVHLIKIELNQANKNFEKDVNQLDRYKAFRNLFKLAVNIEVSDRLQTKAYDDFDVYNR